MPADNTAPRAWTDSVTVRNPVTLPSTLQAQRIPIGVQGDYKPALVALPNGQLLLAMFLPITNKDGTYEEDTTLYRSGDGGQTWDSGTPLPGLGREAYFTLLSDGTLLMTASVISTDYRNTTGYTYAVLYRSSDGGVTWTSTNIQSADAPGGTTVVTSRNVLELADGTLMLGVGAKPRSEYLWRSHDMGLTWDKTLVPADPPAPFNEAANTIPWVQELVLSQAGNGDLLGIARVYCTAVPAIATLPKDCAGNDLETLDVLLRSHDGGQTWTLDPPLGTTYGEMYASLRPLPNNRVLFTYTVRSLGSPLGVNAVFGTESASGFLLTLTSDVLLLDAETPSTQPSGGGFGNTVQASDGTFVTSYSYRAGNGNTYAAVVRWKLP